MTDGRHQLAERRSLALHRAVADRLRSQPELLGQVRGRVRHWLATASVHEDYARAWQSILDRPLPEILAFLTDAGPRATALRQSSPFAGILRPRERWEILRSLAQSG